MVSPEATFDCMAICNRMAWVAGGASESEIAHLSYLACLLSVYRGSPPSEWGYDFAATTNASPFSVALNSAIGRLKSAHLLDDAPQGLRLSELGRAELKRYARLAIFANRLPILEAACSSVIAVPLSTLSRSLSAEPQLRRALQLSSTRPLLDSSGRHAIMAHFKALASAVPDAEDLFVPAVVWLSYLSEQADKLDNDGGS